jgi:Tfp pilus assembly protein PilV
MKKMNFKKNKGFVILFAVTISSILLTIALGVANIALKEIKFGTNARDTNEAFFAADTGTELALFNDKSTSSSYASGSYTPFSVFGLGSTGQGCTYVTVDKTSPPTTKVIAKGYNTGVNMSGVCTSVSNSVERELKTTYSSGSSLVTQNVNWTNIVGVSVSGNNLTKIVSNGWNAGASSVQNISFGDGYAEFTASETNTSRRLGLSNGDSNQSWDDIDFCVYLDSDGTFYVNEGANPRGSFGTYTTGDIFRVSVEGGLVKYRKNGTLFYTSAVAPAYPLLVDTALYSSSSTLTNAQIAF